jgi:hypothetical protein
VEDLERRFGRLPAACILAVAVQLISLSLYAPALWMPMPLRYIRMYEPLVEDPWRTDAHAEPAVRHRLLGPVIAHYLGLRGIWSTIPQWLGVTGFLATLYCLLRRDLDASASFRVVLLIGTTLAVITSQTWMGFQEGIGHFAIVLCLWFGRAWAVIPLLFLGMLAEERTAAAVPFLVCWQFIFAKQQRWVRAIVWGLAGLVTVALWFIYLKWVHTQFLPAGILEQSDWQEMPGTHFYLKYINNVPLGWFETLRAGWLLPALAVGLWCTQRRWWDVVIFGLAIALCLGQAGLVMDISRAGAFAWPAILIAARALAAHDPAKFLNALNLALLLNVLSPCYQVILSRGIYLYWPLPLAALRAVLGF